MNRTYVLTSDTPCQNPSSSWISAPEFLGPNAGMGNYRRQCNEPFWPIQDKGAGRVLGQGGRIVQKGHPCRRE